MKSSGAKRVMRQNKKIRFSLVFASYAMSTHFSAKRVIKLSAPRVRHGVLLSPT